MKAFYNKTTAEVRKEINGTLKPLSNEQVRKNQEKYGLNELVEAKAKSIPIIFLEQFKDFLVIILIFAALISGFLGDLETKQDVNIDGETYPSGRYHLEIVKNSLKVVIYEK